jgi:hypothetical protein
VRKRQPVLGGRGGTRTFEYYMVGDDPTVEPSQIRHVLTEVGLRQVV